MSVSYAGQRPQEALGLPWSNVRGRTLLIDRAQSDEGLKDTDRIDALGAVARTAGRGLGWPRMRI